MCLGNVLGTKGHASVHKQASLVTVDIRGAVKKFPELWYSTVMVGHMTTIT